MPWARATQSKRLTLKQVNAAIEAAFPGEGFRVDKIKGGPMDGTLFVVGPGVAPCHFARYLNLRTLEGWIVCVRAARS